MGRKSRFTPEQKIQAVRDYLDGKKSAIDIAHDIGLKTSYPLYKWRDKYLKYGEEAFFEKKHNNAYSKEFKEMVVREYNQGDLSSDELALKYNIPARGTVSSWVKRYNSHEELTDYDPKGEVYMTEGRKTTYEERIEIVRYCIAHNRSYKDAAAKYDVSYNQVYRWVKKFNDGGEEALADRRGHRKPEEELDEEEKLRREIRKLENELEEERLKIRVLKKVLTLQKRDALAGTGNRHSLRPSKNSTKKRK